VLVLPAFAEEMNKCRRMVTEVALGLVDCGVAVVVPDLMGTGDSGGDFSDATWHGWLGDVARTAKWSADQGFPVTATLAIRTGCALAAAAIATGLLPPVGHSVFWQPVFDGDRFLTQFLRLRLAANLAGDRKESLVDLRSRLASGETIKVAGYSLSGQLAAELSLLVAPALLPAGLGEIAWFEVGREANGPLPTSSQSVIERTREQDGAVRERLFAGEPFWATSEIVVVPEMIGATIAHLGSALPPEGR
jgi:exosortase A-associated hydrolase 2